MTGPVAYVTQEMWDDVQEALRAVLRVVDCMPEGHHRESLRNIATPRLRSPGGARVESQELGTPRGEAGDRAGPLVSPSSPEPGDKVAEALALYEGARAGKLQMTQLCDELTYCLRELRPTLNTDDLKPFFVRLRARIDAVLERAAGCGHNQEPTQWGRAPEPPGEWRPASTAPKDESLVLCTGIPVDTHRYGTGPWYTVAVYRGGYYYDDSDGELLAEPSHWMPCPTLTKVEKP